MRPFALLLLLLCLCQTAFAQSGSLPLKLMPNKAFSDVQTQAGYDSISGPVFSNSPTTLPFHATLTGSVTADSTMTKLAIFSDDGCDVYVNGTRVWNALDVGQALPNISQSLHELPVTMTPGQTYSIRIDYSNIYYGAPDPRTGQPLDIDGCTLFMYGSGNIPSLNVGSNKSAICAGAVASGPHQATITATLKDPSNNPLPNQTITFAITNSNPAYPSTLTITTVTTDSNGNAVTTLTSSQKVNATAVVTATFGSLQAQTNPITMGMADGAWTINPQTIIADGVSTSSVQLALSYQGMAVDQHQITWRINRAWDGNGNLVYQADPASGSYSGYGSVAPTSTASDSSGYAQTVYTVGTLGGTVEFAALDTSIVENSPGMYTSSASPIQFAVSKINEQNDVPYRLENSYAGQPTVPNRVVWQAHFDGTGNLIEDKSSEVTEVCDKINHNFLSNIKIATWPANASIANVTWRYTYSIFKPDNTVISTDTKNGSGVTGAFNVATGSNVGVYNFSNAINVYQNGQWNSNFHQNSPDTLYQIYSNPLGVESTPAILALRKACSYIAGQANSQDGCATAIMLGVHGEISYNPNVITKPEPLDLYLETPQIVGQCGDHGNIQCELLESIGIHANPERWYADLNGIGQIWYKKSDQGKPPSQIFGGTMILNPGAWLFVYHVIAKTSDGRYDSALGHKGMPNITDIYTPVNNHITTQELTYPYDGSFPPLYDRYRDSNNGQPQINPNE